MKQLPLITSAKDTLMSMYIVYAEEMNTVYVAIFRVNTRDVQKEKFFHSIKMEEFNRNTKLNIVYCGEGNKRMLIFVISTLRETGIQIRQHEYSAITFDELEECLKES